MFSTALETMKFLSETSPIIGLSVASGTSTFLAPALEYLVAIGENLKLVTVKMKNVLQK